MMVAGALGLLIALVALLTGLVILIGRDMLRYKRETTKRLEHIATLLKRNGS